VLPITLAACGGSSGGSSAPPSPPVNTTALPITGDNAQDVTESVLEAVASSTDLIDIADVVGLPVIGGTSQGNSEPASGDVFTDLAACDSGDVTTTWNDADDDLQVSTGDTFDIQFDLCFLQEPEITLDGAATIDELTLTGDPTNLIAPWSLDATFGYADLTVTDALDAVIINGDLDLAVSSDNGIVINGIVGSAFLTVDVNGVIESLSDFLMTQRIDENALTRTIAADGIYTSDTLEGSVTFETLEVFVVMGDDNPSSGQLLISDGRSSVLVTVLDNLNVQLGIDLDLDGTTDQTLTVTWAELDIG
jgi:hypothetical protein